MRAYLRLNQLFLIITHGDRKVKVKLAEGFCLYFRASFSLFGLEGFVYMW